MHCIDADAVAQLAMTEDLAVPAHWVQNPGFNADWPHSCAAGQDLELIVETARPVSKTRPELHYRHTNQMEGEFRILEMQRCESGYRAVIPGEYLENKWDLLVYITQVDAVHNVVVFPGIYHPEYPAPYHHITVI